MKKYLSLVAALALVAICSPVAAVDTETACQATERAWLEAHAGQLPQSFSEIMALPTDERLIAYRGLGAATQSAIWRGHLDHFLAEEGTGLTDAQRELVARASLVATPELFAHRSGDPGFEAAKAPLRQIVQDAKAHFSHEQIIDLFYRLGGEAKASKDPKGEDEGRALCNCNDYFDCQFGPCRFPPPLCIAYIGCGEFYTDPCGGRCG